MEVSRHECSISPARTVRCWKAAVSVLAVLFLFAGAGNSIAGPKRIAADGTFGSCTFKGKLKMHPKMTFSGTRGATTLRLKGKLTDCSGGSGDGAGVVGASVRGIIWSAFPSNDCIQLIDGTIPGFDVQMFWKTSSGSPKLLPTTFHVAGGFFHVNDPGGIMELIMMGHGGGGGSFASSVIILNNTADVTLAAMSDACMAHSKGLSQVLFTGVNGASSMSD